MKKTAITSLLVILVLNAFSQSYRIDVKIKGIKDSIAYLASYTGSSPYFYDTAVVKSDGSFSFTKDTMPHGVYAIIYDIKKPAYFDILVNERRISLETTLTDNPGDIIPNARVKKSNENKVFFDYIKFLKGNTEKKTPLLQQRNIARDSNDKEKVTQLEKEIYEIDQSVINYQRNLVAKHSKKYVGKLVKMSLEINIPEPTTKVEDTNQAKYQYYINHFWDNVDLSDDRLGKSALFHNQMETYFLKIIPQAPDTIIKRIDEFMNQLTPNGFMMKSAVGFLAYAHAKTKLMGMDAVYVHVADNYILNGKSEWITKANREKLRPKVDKLRPVLIGKIAPNITLADTSEKKWINLHRDVKTKYTLLVFWADDCGHCKKEIPKYKKIYDSIKANTNVDIEVYAVGTIIANDKWKEFIIENELTWINVSDFQDMRDNPDKYVYNRSTDINSINYRNTYDVFVTPIAYLLDENKQILAKQFTPEQFIDVLRYQVKRDQEKKE